jgi:threonine/homoserine/homoserine lactone efflux protein
LSVSSFHLFLLAALIVAIVPGPGMFYVAARTLSGGRRTGLASTAGTALGGMVHVVGIGIGISVIILASAELFTALKFAGAIYLVWLGLKTFRAAGRLPAEVAHSAKREHAFFDGIVVEALNPKTAAFFLAFIPQFLDPAAPHPAVGFMALGLVSVMLNTLADIVVVLTASATRNLIANKPSFLRRLRQGSGLFIMGLGLSLALVRRPASS